ncbi:MAG: hypothetical protein KBG22_09985 [Smithella sp.]|nr:hypothetical protein [Smithella sp.]
MQTALNLSYQIKQDIENYMRQFGGRYSDWYAGVASDPRKRLFIDHNVDEKNGAWIFRDCGSDAVARNIEDYFLNKGCKGGPGGGDYTTRYVYAYRIGSNTVE